MVNIISSEIKVEPLDQEQVTVDSAAVETILEQEEAKTEDLAAALTETMQETAAVDPQENLQQEAPNMEEPLQVTEAIPNAE